MLVFCILKKKLDLLKKNVGEEGVVRDHELMKNPDIPISFFVITSILSMLKKIKERIKKMIMNDQIVWVMVPPTCQCKEIIEKAIILKIFEIEKRKLKLGVKRDVHPCDPYQNKEIQQIKKIFS